MNPTASFTSTATLLSIDFDASASSDSDGTIDSYAWDFGDGSAVVTSASPTVTHVYAVNGVYSVTLTVTDNDSNTDAVSNQVFATDGSGNSVFAVANSNVTTGDAPLTVTFDTVGTVSYAELDGGISYRSWNFDDGSPAFLSSSLDTPFTHTFNLTGTYDVTLTVMTYLGFSDVDTIQIVVTGEDFAPIAVANSNVTTGDAPLTVTFDSIGTASQPGGPGLASRVWSFDDGTVNYFAPDDSPFQHTFTDPGPYNVVLTVTDNDGVVVTDTITITVTGDAPVAVIIIDDTTIYEGQSVNVSSSNSTGFYYPTVAWDFGDGDPPTYTDTGSASYEYQNMGVYTVTLTLDGGQFGYVSATTTVYVFPSELIGAGSQEEYDYFYTSLRDRFTEEFPNVPFYGPSYDPGEISSPNLAPEDMDLFVEKIKSHRTLMRSIDGVSLIGDYSGAEWAKYVEALRTGAGVSGGAYDGPLAISITSSALGDLSELHEACGPQDVIFIPSNLQDSFTVPATTSRWSFSGNLLLRGWVDNLRLRLNTLSSTLAGSDLELEIFRYDDGNFVSIFSAPLPAVGSTVYIGDIETTNNIAARQFPTTQESLKFVISGIAASAGSGSLSVTWISDNRESLTVNGSTVVTR
jgi:PKD repeat protein